MKTIKKTLERTSVWADAHSESFWNSGTKLTHGKHLALQSTNRSPYGRYLAVIRSKTHAATVRFIDLGLGGSRDRWTH